MSVELDWKIISIRLLLTVIAGLVIGFNRGEHGRPAGMRTTLLVCLAASLSMILANSMLNTAGKASNSFIQLDLMRLPLGVLSGMGFIGAGTILRKGNLITGITTAATLWYVTLMGMCFGAGQLGLGIVALVLGFGTLWGLKHLETQIHRDASATLKLRIAGDVPTDVELYQQIVRGSCEVSSWGTSCDRDRNERDVFCEVQWHPPAGNILPPPIVHALREHAAIKMVCWEPQGVSPSGQKQQTKPIGTPIPIQP